MHGTEGGRGEREKEKGDYNAERGEDSGEDREEYKWGEDTKGSSSESSGSSGASTTGDDEYLVGGTDGPTGVGFTDRTYKRQTDHGMPHTEPRIW